MASVLLFSYKRVMMSKIILSKRYDVELRRRSLFAAALFDAMRLRERYCDAEEAAGSPRVSR